MKSALRDLKEGLEEIVDYTRIEEHEKMPDGSQGPVVHIDKTLDPWELVSLGAVIGASAPNCLVYDGTNDDICVAVDL